MVFLQETLRVAMIIVFECAVLAKMKHSDVPFMSNFIFVVPGLAVCWITHATQAGFLFVHVCVCVRVHVCFYIYFNFQYTLL